MMKKQTALLLVTLVLLASCAGQTQKRATLRSVDISGAKESSSGRYLTPKSDADIRIAYSEYLRYASKKDRSRISALNRLAELEFELSEKLLKKKGDENTDVETLDNKLYNAQLDRTIELLNTSLRDYPNAKGNDKTLYQLAQAYEQRGQFELSHTTLAELVKKHPKSNYYIEAKFRLAEDAFSSKKYSDAEEMYTEIIGAKKRSIFYEKALYKRGWARYKQEFYFEAVDDFTLVVNLNKFDDYHNLSKAQKDLFDEYFRAIGLSFSYLGGARPLDKYLKEHPDFKHVYYTYAHMADIYAKQERFSDAVRTLNSFATFNPKSEHVPEALLKTISIWQQAAFTAKMVETLEPFYEKYHPESKYWQNKGDINPRIYKLVKNSLREYMLTATAFLHKRSLLAKEQKDIQLTQKWYENYLKHYKAYSRQDNIHFLYASFLAENKQYISALNHYEVAAFDSDIIINSDAAYESILIASHLAQTSKDKNQIANWLNKLIHYSTLYSQQNSNDKRTIKVIAHASQLAYRNNMFKETVSLAELITGDSSSSLFATNINTIKAHSYFKLAKYQDAESTYLDVLRDSSLQPKFRAPAVNGLALAIYYQGKTAAEQKEINQAINHYSRIAVAAPSTTLAPTGLYDAIALAMKNELWSQAIKSIETFQQRYPNHQYSQDVAKKLYVAYLNTKQDKKAADTLVGTATKDESSEYQSASLWKAGELYESQKEYPNAIKTFEEYARKFPRPFPQHMEAMYKLVTMNVALNNIQQVDIWQQKIVEADKKAPATIRNDRTKLIASNAALHLARNSYLLFSKIQLVQPFQASLLKKSNALKQTVSLYGRASSYGVPKTATEATHTIAQIYSDFNKAILQSERPRGLSAEASEQYNILLEDKAYPFEENAIKFYEINLTYVKDDIYDEWVEKSHAELKRIFPVRYKREAKLDGFINVLH